MSSDPTQTAPQNGSTQPAPDLEKPEFAAKSKKAKAAESQNTESQNTESRDTVLAVEQPVEQPAEQPVEQPEPARTPKKARKTKRIFDGSTDFFSAKISKQTYEAELQRLQIELVKMQYWIKRVGYRVIVIFEGRDAAGKGGVIKRIVEPLNPRGCNVVALGTPSDREKTQWYFQRYVQHLPAAGEIALFDRSWYNRAGVERVMGFCTDTEYQEFMQSCPEFERMLVRSGIVLIKYWFSVSDDEQEKRFRSRSHDPAKRWKLSPMDLESRDRWVEYSKAKDAMFARTNIPEAPWFTIEADDKKRARLNCIHHLLSKVPYEDMTPPPLKLGPRPAADDYVRAPRNEQFFVPQVY
ncbi:MAG: polyphosphate kinase 2 [Elainella sp.]